MKNVILCSRVFPFGLETSFFVSAGLQAGSNQKRKRRGLKGTACPETEIRRNLLLPTLLKCPEAKTTEKESTG